MRRSYSHRTSPGFYIGGTVTPPVTNAITIEFERARALDLRQHIGTSLERDTYKKWAWETCSKQSGVFLLSPTDHFGYMEDTVFQVAFATYLGQACPVIAPLV